ncbi:hypothetical protein L1887_52048 [Cichorium endivia]|nr:hypothetical protein L1887_52048 [Cichorium endivia]
MAKYRRADRRARLVLLELSPDDHDGAWLLLVFTAHGFCHAEGRVGGERVEIDGRCAGSGLGLVALCGRCGGRRANNKHLETITHLDVTLGGGGERVDDDLEHLGQGHLARRGYLAFRRVGLVPEHDLVVKERLDERLGRTCSTAELALVASDGVERVDCALALFVEAAEDVVDVVGEEALAVEHGGDHAGDRVQWHRTSVCMAVHLEPLTDARYERLGVGCEPVGRQRRLVVQSEHLGLVARLDVVARALARVGCDHAKVTPAHGCNAATVGVVGRELMTHDMVLGRSRVCWPARRAGKGAKERHGEQRSVWQKSWQSDVGAKGKKSVRVGRGDGIAMRKGWWRSYVAASVHLERESGTFWPERPKPSSAPHDALPKRSSGAAFT